MRYVRVFRIFTAAVILSLLAVAIPAPPAQAAGTLIVSPASGKIGDTVTVTGYDFTPTTTIDRNAVLYFSSQEATTVDTVATTSDVANPKVTIFKIVKDGFWIDYDGAIEANTTFTVPAKMDDGPVTADVVSGTYYLYLCYYTTVNPPLVPTVIQYIKAVATFTLIGGKIVLGSSQGQTGSQVSITGSEFNSNQDITIQYDGTATSILSGDRQTNSSGTFISSITIPPSIADAHTITASVAGSTVSAQYTVIPKITISPASGQVNTVVTVSGTGFGRRTTVTIFFNNYEQPDKLPTGPTGSFSGIFNVPQTVTGTYNVEADDNQSTPVPRVSFTVIPVPTATPTPTPTPTPTATPTPTPTPATSLSLSPTSGRVGTELTISGTTFPANRIISIKYDDQAIALATTDSSGNFKSSFKVPASKGGDHVITITDGTNTKTLTFTLQSEPPAVPAPLRPQMGIKVKPPVYFDWQDVTSDSPPVTYTLQVATDRAFTTASIVLEEKGLTKSEYTPTKDEELKLAGKETIYYWRVKAIDATLKEGGWTGAGEFFVTPPFTLPGWAIYVLIAVGGLILFFLGFWLGRRATYY